jgi:hypothetical protein
MNLAAEGHKARRGNAFQKSEVFFRESDFPPPYGAKYPYAPYYETT